MLVEDALLNKLFALFSCVRFHLNPPRRQSLHLVGEHGAALGDRASKLSLVHVREDLRSGDIAQLTRTPSIYINGERDNYDNDNYDTCACTLIPPALSPKMVTRSGSPPNSP